MSEGRGQQRRSATKDSRPTKSYLKFESVIERSLNLLSLQSPISSIIRTCNQPPLDLSDLSRAAIVLAIAAMDSYFTDVFAERLVPFLKSRGRTPALVDLLSRAGLDTALALDLLAMQRPYTRIRRLVECSLGRRTTQKADCIDSLFLAFGLRDFCHHAQRLKNRRMLLRSVDAAVARRNQIAHDGDMRGSRLCKIDSAQARRRVRDIVALVSGADEVLQRQLPV